MRLFRTKATPDTDGFFTTVAADQVQPGQMTTVTINGHKLILTCWEGDLAAFSSVCPHAAADLSRGWLGRGKVTCPDHDYCFQVSDGRLLWPEDEPYRLKMYDVKVDDGLIKVRL